MKLNSADVSPDVVALNPELFDDSQPVAARLPADPSSLAAQFEQTWAMLGGPGLKKEYRFHPTRMWRADYCHEATKTIIELEGGVWTNGRHLRGQGFLDDCEKYNAAACMGYTVFRLGTGMATADHIGQIVYYVNRVDEFPY